jgi:hypothetical protein
MTRWTRFATASKAAVVAALFVVAFSTPAHAAAIIDFSSGYTLAGGTMTVDAWGNVIGSNIGIDLLEVSGTGRDGTYDVSGGVLSFDTANHKISIVGSVSSLGIYNQTLLIGSISSFDFDTGPFNVLGLFSATGPDSKSPKLLDALGIPRDSTFQYFGFSIGFDKTPLNDNHTYNVVNADIVNTQVPEPSTIALLAMGFVGLAGNARRRLRGAKSLDC